MCRSAAEGGQRCAAAAGAGARRRATYAAAAARGRTETALLELAPNAGHRSDGHTRGPSENDLTLPPADGGLQGWSRNGDETDQDVMTFDRDGAFGDPPAPVPVPDLHWSQAQGRIADLVENVQADMIDAEAWGGHRPMVRDGQEITGWQVTPAAVAAERRLVTVGGLVDVEATRRAAPEIADVDADEEAAIGYRTDAIAVLRYEVATRHTQARRLRHEFALLADQPSYTPREQARLAALAEQHEEVIADSRAWVHSLHELEDGSDPFSIRRSNALAAATRDVLREVRPMGAGSRDTGMLVPLGDHGRTPVVAAMANFPSAWHERCTGTGLPLIVLDGQERGLFSPDLLVPPSSLGQALRPGSPGPVVCDVLSLSCGFHNPTRPEGYATACHEMTHRMEVRGCPTLYGAQQAFLERRVAVAGRRPAKTSYRGNAGEMVWPDHFTNGYIGRDYGPIRDCAEVLTVGVESVFAGVFGGGTGQGSWRADPDHRRFTLGTLSTL